MSNPGPFVTEASPILLDSWQDLLDALPTRLGLDEVTATCLTAQEKLTRLQKLLETPDLREMRLVASEDRALLSEADRWCAALANKLVRICWAVWRTGTPYQPCYGA